MKELVIKIYNNSRQFYGIGMASGLFLIFISFKGLNDFFAREAVLSFSLFTTIFFSGLLIQELSNSKIEKKEEEVAEEPVEEKEEEVEVKFESNNTNNEDIPKEERTYMNEWEIGEMKYEYESQILTLKQEIEALQAKLKKCGCEDEDGESKNTAKTTKAKPKTTKKKTLKVPPPYQEDNQPAEAAGFIPDAEDSSRG